MAFLKVVGILYSPLFLVFFKIFFSQRVLLTLLLIARFVCAKISKTRGILSKARSYVTKKSLLLLFFFSSLSVSHILQHNMEFYISYKHYQQNLLVTEKNCSNNLCCRLQDPSKPIFEKLGYLSLFKIYCKLEVKDYSTRYAKSYRPHTCRTNIKKFSILYQGPKFQNSLPHSIIRSNNIRTFRVILLDS